LIKKGNVRIDAVRITKPSALVSAPNILTIAYANRIRILKFLLPGTKRGPASQAQTLYEDQTPQLPRKTKSLSSGPAIREPGSGRPTKKQRRQTDQLLNRL